MFDNRFPLGPPDFNSTVQLEYASTPVSGVLEANENYRVCSDADAMVGFGEENDEGFLLSNGHFLGADQELHIAVGENSKFCWAVAPILTTSGIITFTKLRK